MTKLGKKIKQLRESRELTQQALAEKSGLHLVTIGQLEADMKKPRIPTLATRKKLAVALGVPVTELLD